MANTSIAVSNESWRAFKVKCKSFDIRPTDQLRELITAFTDGRIKITPTDEQIAREKHYDQG